MAQHGRDGPAQVSRPRQTTVAYLGRVEEDQVPFLKAAYSKRKPRLVWDDEAGS